LTVLITSNGDNVALDMKYNVELVNKNRMIIYMFNTMKSVALVFAMLLALVGCGGGGGGGDGAAAAPATTQASLDVTGVTIDLTSGQYSLVTETTASTVSAEGTEIAIDTPVAEKGLVMLTDVTGEPILLGQKLAGDESVEVSVESSAEVFVLMSSRFFGIKFTDPSLLSQRIRAHASFVDLVAELTQKINSGSKCPMDPNCSFVASMIADKIANEISISDLVQ
jgi:hypothetical protein